jgi:hypothetical protein
MHFERSGIPEGTWNGWRAWCLRQSEDPLSPGLNKVLDFLAMLCEEGKAYRTINVCRSISLKAIDCFDVGKHSMVMKVMRRIYNVKPPAPPPPVQ